ALAAFLFGIEDMPLSTVVFVHAGTLLATLLVLRRDIVTLLEGAIRLRRQGDEAYRREVLGILVASVPTAVIGLYLERTVEAWAHLPLVVGLCFLWTAGFVLWTRRGGGGREQLTWSRYFAIGVAQGLAVLPGLSRSASTIATGMGLGLSGPAAFRFSFLISLPAVGGAVLVKIIDPQAWATLDAMTALAAVVSFASGYAALLLLRRLVMRGRFWVFAIYLVPLGASLALWGLSRGH
ncbi:MAG: undecaprenyl-diphosphate phosphatase, partial [Myxococcales bacterium]|nr:undecaprenyl-diphosphate phosphatase [Myxococcales bacterium]